MGCHSKKHCKCKKCRESEKCNEICTSPSSCNGNCSRNPCVELNYTDITDINNSIYSMYRVFNDTGIKILEDRDDLCYKIKKIYPGTEASKDAPVFGYEKDGKTLIKNGGMKKSYKCDFKTYKIQYNGADNSKLVVYNKEVINSGYKKVVSFFAQRGFQFQSTDKPKEYDDLYANVNSYGGPTMQFGKKCSNGIPKYVDFTYVNYAPITIKSYEPDSSKFINGAAYPIRIPITTDFCGKFNAKYDTEPIAYYDKEKGILTIHIPEVDQVGHFNSFYKTVYGDANINLEHYVLSYDNSFQLLKRDSDNNIVKASFKDVQYFAQVKEPASAKRRILNNGPDISVPGVFDAGDNFFDDVLLMYQGSGVKITTPLSIASTIETPTATFGPSFYNIPVTDIVPTVPAIGLPVITNNVAGKIALIRRGGGTFVSKALAAQAAGAIGVIIYNSTGGQLVPGGSNPNVTIPCVGMTQDKGNLLVANQPVTGAMSSSILQYYGGQVLQLLGGDNSKYNVNAFPNTVNANVNPIAPTDNSYLTDFGDNNSSIFNENTSNLSGTNCFDTIQWTKTFRTFPKDFLSGAYYPEQAGSAPIPQMVSTKEDAIISILMHEYTHITNYATGGLPRVPTEAMATAIENDPKASFGNMDSSRNSSWTQGHLGFTRGNYSVAYPEFLIQITDNTIASTYCMSFFWQYLKEQFDHNHQVMRRLNDLLSTKEIVNLYLQQDCIPNYSTNYVGTALNLDRALNELFGRNLRTTFFNFCVSMMLLRNNISIPREYQTDFPYWMNNSAYAGIAEWTAASAAQGPSLPYITWWETLDKNLVVPPTYTGNPIPPGTVGETFFKTLPSSVTLEANDLTMFGYSVPNTIQTININVTSGNWMFALLQFTSDNTPVGKFIFDGPHTVNGTGTLSFQVSNHVPAFTETGIIKLVCSNTTVSDSGDLMNYLGPFVVSGNATITTV